VFLVIIIVLGITVIFFHLHTISNCRGKTETQNSARSCKSVILCVSLIIARSCKSVILRLLLPQAANILFFVFTAQEAAFEPDFVDAIVEVTNARHFPHSALKTSNPKSLQCQLANIIRVR
jgi:hypothetical protein